MLCKEDISFAINTTATMFTRCVAAILMQAKPKGQDSSHKSAP